MIKKLYQIFFLLLTGLVLLYIFGCASGGKQFVEQLNIPPGLDSTTVIQANNLAEKTFVSTDREEQAEKLTHSGKKNLDKVDEFWAYLEKKVKKGKSLTKAEQTQFNQEYTQGEKALARWKELTQNPADEKAGQAAQVYCVLAQEHLEKAVRINPFDKKARVLLAVAYYNLQHIFGQQQQYEKAIEILERLTRIEKGEHELFRLLAENYLALKNYEKALLNFKKGRAVLIKTSFEAPPDTSLQFYYVYAQGDAYARLYQAEVAQKAFRVATKYARTKQESTDVKNYQEWIHWDGGNIKASEQWDRILALEAAKDYDKMAQACRKLLPQLQTTKAKLMVNHKLAVVEFEFLDQKAAAAERMHQMFSLLPPEVLNAKKAGDLELKPFMEAYGAMLYRLGIIARDQQEKKQALAYFTKATSFEWDQMAKAYIELVTILWNNPDEAIRHGKKALENTNGLTEQEACELLSLMVRAHKSAGKYDEARVFFDQWKKCRSKYASAED